MIAEGKRGAQARGANAHCLCDFYYLFTQDTADCFLLLLATWYLLLHLVLPGMIVRVPAYQVLYLV